MSKVKVLLLCFALAALMALTACGGGAGSAGSGASSADSANSASAAADSGGAGSKVIVGSKGFTEAFLLSEIYSLALENNGYEVERMFNMTMDTIVAAMDSGQIDMYPEYLGTALTDILKQEVEMDVDKAYATVCQGYAEKGITWLDLTKMEDKVAMVMRKDKADELGIKTLSDLQKQSADLTLGDGVTFTERPDDLPRMNEYYGEFAFKVEVIDRALMYDLLEDRTVDVIPGLTTDPQLKGDTFVPLVEDIPIWPPQLVAPQVRNDVLEANPGMADVLNGVSAKLTTEGMIDMLDRVVNGGEEYEDVAKDFYEANCK